MIKKNKIIFLGNEYDRMRIEEDSDFVLTKQEDTLSETLCKIEELLPGKFKTIARKDQEGMRFVYSMCIILPGEEDSISYIFLDKSLKEALALADNFYSAITFYQYAETIVKESEKEKNPLLNVSTVSPIVREINSNKEQ